MRPTEHFFWSAMFLLLYIPVSTIVWLYDPLGFLWVGWLIGLFGVGVLNIIMAVVFPDVVFFIDKKKVPEKVEVLVDSSKKNSRGLKKRVREARIVEVKNDDIPVSTEKRGETVVDEFGDEMHNDVDLDELDPHADDPFS